MEAEIRGLALKQSAKTDRYICPSCSSERKNKNDKCLSLTVESNRGVYHCHHCGMSGMVFLTERRDVQVRPKPQPISPPTGDELLTEYAYRWLAGRGITRSIARQAGVIGAMKFIDGQERPSVGFPYVQGGQTYAVKWRAMDVKGFIQDGSASSLWGAEGLPENGPVVICEGECDALSLRQAGVYAVSVPNGAPSKLAAPEKSTLSPEGKFGYLWAIRAVLDKADRIIIAVDSDVPGDALGEEIARRVSRAKCWRALWPDGCKDANEVLLRHGSDVLRECIDNARPWPVKGLYDAVHFRDQINELYDKGLPKGGSTGFKSVDQLYTIVPGQITIVTGSPGSGKSTFVDNILVNAARQHNQRFAICSFENPPNVHAAKLLGIAARTPFFQGPTPRMDRDKRDKVLAWLNDHFFFLHQTDGSLSSLDEIVDLTKAAILRYGINGLVIDPYNFISRGESNETDWVSDALTKLKVLAMAHDIHIWFVAHPTKMRRREDGSFPVPTGYDIAGSAHFFNKADMGITIHRPDPAVNKTEFHTWKVRFSFTGQIGKTNLSYDVATGTYWEPVTGEDE